MHSHADFVLPGLPTADSKVHQGFTLQVVGNCGASPAPLTPARRQDVIDATGLAVPPLAWNWTTFRSYLDVLTRQRLSINVAPLVGHGTVRLVVMGADDARADRRPAPGDGGRGPARGGRGRGRRLDRPDLRARRVRRHRRDRRPGPGRRRGRGLLREPHPGRERHAPAGDRRGDRGRAPRRRPGGDQPSQGRGPVELAEDGAGDRADRGGARRGPRRDRRHVPVPGGQHDAQRAPARRGSTRAAASRSSRGSPTPPIARASGRSWTGREWRATPAGRGSSSRGAPRGRSTRGRPSRASPPRWACRPPTR